MKRGRVREIRQGIIKRHIYEHSALYIMILLIFVVGFVVGSINSAFIEEELKEESQNYILNFVEYLKTQEIDNKILLRESISANIKPVVYIMLFGLVFIGIPLIFVYMGLYAYSIGYTVTSILSTLSTSKGIAFIVTMMLPQEIILLPTIFAISVNAILFSKIMMKVNHRNVDIKTEILKYVMIFVVGITVTIGVSLFETYVGSSFAKFVVNAM